jgi:hypothetical protein
VKGPRGIKKTLQTAATHKTLKHFIAEPPIEVLIFEVQKSLELAKVV